MFTNKGRDKHNKSIEIIIIANFFFILYTTLYIVLYYNFITYVKYLQQQVYSLRLYTHQPHELVVYMHALVFLTVYDFFFRYHNFLDKLVRDSRVSSCKAKKSHRRCVCNSSQTECIRNFSCVCNHNEIMNVINTKDCIHQGDAIRLTAITYTLKRDYIPILRIG